MEHIEWTQDKNNVFFIINDNNNEKKKIKLEPKIVSILVAHTPKIFYVDINIDKKDLNFIVDFSKLKPIIKKAKKLKVSVKSKIIKDASIIQPNENFYKISRGESFMERYLGINGWQAQEFAFPFVAQKDVQKNENPPEISTKYTSINQPKDKPKEQVKTNIKAESEKQNLQECKNCGTIISDNIDYCHNCFEPLFEPQEGVDFTI